MEAKETSVSPFHISLAACGLGAVEGRCLLWLFSVEELGWLRPSCASAGLDSNRRNGFLYPVLKHGPRSLTYVRVQGCQTPVRNESNSGRTLTGHYPPASIPRENGLSVSTHVGTRKMVNYA